MHARHSNTQSQPQMLPQSLPPQEASTPFHHHPPVHSPQVLASTPRSSGIPLPSSHIPKTHSEIQLDIDEAAAEVRDTSMFYRVLNGIRDRQQTRSIASRSRPRSPIEPTSDEHRWENLEEIRGRVSDMSDEWSITGFGENGTAGTMSTTPKTTSPADEEELADDIEGVFDLDL